MEPITIGIGMTVLAIISALNASSCSNDDSTIKNGKKDGGNDGPDGARQDSGHDGSDASGPISTDGGSATDAGDASVFIDAGNDAGNRDAGSKADAGDSGNIHFQSDGGDGGIVGGTDGSVDGGDAGSTDAGPTVRSGINDSFAKMPCNTLADLDVVDDKLLGLCNALKIFQCPFPSDDNQNSLCTTVATLPEMVNNRRVIPHSQEDMGNNLSLITFISQGNAGIDDTGAGVFFLDRTTWAIQQTFSFHSAQYIGAGGNIYLTPTDLNSALVYQNKLFLGTQSNYDISDDGTDPISRGVVFAFAFLDDGTVDPEPAHGAFLISGKDNPLHFIIKDADAILNINGGGSTQSSIDEISVATPNLVQSNALSNTSLNALPNLAMAETQDAVIMASAQTPWKLVVMDINNKTLLQERDVPEINGGVSGVVISGINVFVTDATGHLLWFDFTNNHIGDLLNDTLIALDPAGPSAFHGTTVYQPFSGTDPRIVAINPQQLPN